jgi:signal transduction histidine kinase/DNA-binding response OmpR family regulator
MTRPLIALDLRFEQDVVHARQRAREISGLLGFDHSEQIRLATAVSEIARNAFRYARAGRVEFLTESDPAKLVIRVLDGGNGIHNLDQILEGRYRSNTGLGKGIIGTRRLMDSFLIESSPKGTAITMGKYLPKYAPALTAARIDDVTRKLLQRRPENPYEEIERQNQELLKTLAELRSRQEELVLLNNELEDTNRGVVALYAELDDRADALRRMSDAKTSFLSNMSHEFRTPLNSILSLSQMMLHRLDGDLTPEQEKQVSYIRSSAQGLQEMVNDLLDLAKVEAGKVDVKPREFEVEDLFGALRGMLKPILQTASVSLVFEEEPELPSLFTDEGKVSQILRNFISNALKFTERGEVRVRASMIDDQTIAFSVADTGIGIAPENQARVFEEFVQVESKLQTRTKGTGLGLPLSKHLAQLLGGKVTLESELGIGSTFSLQVPIVFSKIKEDEGDDLPDLQPNRQPVLLLEDNQDTSFLIWKSFENTEFQVLRTHSFEGGRNLLARARPIGAILNVSLNGESSWEFLQELRSRHPGLPVVMISIAAAEESKAIALGANVFFEKPVNPDDLVKTMRVLTHQGPLRKLLLIDDSELARYSVRDALRPARLEIIEARSGREGLLLAERETPDAIVLDLKMPDMTGFEVLEHLRVSEFGRVVPVIIHSSQPLSIEERERLRLPGVVVFPKSELSESEPLERLSRVFDSVGFNIEIAGRQHA